MTKEPFFHEVFHMHMVYVHSWKMYMPGTVKYMLVNVGFIRGRTLMVRGGILWRSTSSVLFYIIPSRVSGRGYKIGPVCLSVRLSVCCSALSRLNGLTYGHERLHRSILWWRMMSRDVIVWRHAVTSFDNFWQLLTSFDNFWARILTRRACRGRARQCSGVFIRAGFLESQLS